MNALLPILGFLAGTLLPVQAAMNSQLRKSLNQPFAAAFASFVVGLIGVTIAALIINRNVPVLSDAKGPTWMWLGGFCGAIWVVTMILLTPKIGALTATAAGLAGQICMATVLDHYGVLNLPTHSLSPGRAIGVVLLVSGLVLVQRF